MEGQEALIHAIHLNAGKNYDLITDIFWYRQYSVSNPRMCILLKKIKDLQNKQSWS